MNSATHATSPVCGGCSAVAVLGSEPRYNYGMPGGLARLCVASRFAGAPFAQWDRSHRPRGCGRGTTLSRGRAVIGSRSFDEMGSATFRRPDLENCSHSHPA